MKQKNMLITGASRGLGFALAEQARDAGYRVYSGVRKIAKAPKGTLAVELDLLREETFAPLVEAIGGDLDVVIHNAGVAYWGASDGMRVEEMREMFEVNFFAPFRLTQLLLPHMRKKGGTIVFVSSVRAIESAPFMGAYSGSKAALESLAFDFAVSLKRWNMSVMVVEPGPLNSGIELKHGSYFAEGENPYLPYPQYQLEPQSVDDAARVIMDALLSAAPLPFRLQTSRAVRDTVASYLVDPSGNKGVEEQEQLLCSATPGEL